VSLIRYLPLTLLACGETVINAVPAADVEIEPSPLQLVRAQDAPCAPHTLALRGDAVLLGLSWQPDAGADDAIVPPTLSHTALDRGLELTLDYCPDDTPSAGWLLFALDEDELLRVYAEEAP
jgi:hypothetical protein